VAAGGEVEIGGAAGEVEVYIAAAWGILAAVAALSAWIAGSPTSTGASAARWTVNAIAESGSPAWTSLNPTGAGGRPAARAAIA
jgi:hypothetical protein